MAEVERMDVFRSVHKGLRSALSALVVQAGRTDAFQAEEVEALSLKAGEAFHFVAHHALNEDRYLLPAMVAKAIPEADAMRKEHASLEAELEVLRRDAVQLSQAPGRLHRFYLALSRFVSDYLAHLHQEETDILPVLHARFTDAELGEFPRQSVANTSPADQAMMLAYMFPAMDAAELKAFFAGVRGKVPAEMLAHLEGIARRTLGERADSIL